MSRRRKMCMVRVILKSNEADNLSYHKRNLTKTKRYVLCFLQKLYQFGYRHFVIYINDPIDFWLAEMLYFMHYCKKYADVVYSLINLEIHIYETKPKTTPTRFNKISSISKTPTLSNCCASSAAHIAKKAMPICRPPEETAILSRGSKWIVRPFTRGNILFPAHKHIL